MIIEKFKSLPDNPTSSIVVIFTILYSLYLANGVFDNFVWASLWIALRSFLIIIVYLAIIEQAGADSNKKIEVYLKGWGIVFIIYLFMYFGTGDGSSCVSRDMYGCDEYAYDESSVREHSFSEFFSNLIFFILFVTFAIFRSFSWHENIISKKDIMKSLKNIYIVIIKFIIMSPYWLSCILSIVGLFYLITSLTFNTFINLAIVMVFWIFILMTVFDIERWKWLENYCDKVVKNIEK